MSLLKQKLSSLPTALWLVPTVLLLGFFCYVIYIFYFTEASKVTDQIFQAIGIASFIGLFCQFVVSIAQELHKHRLYKIAFIAKTDSPFSSALLGAVRSYFSDNGGFAVKCHLVQTKKTSDAIATAIDEALRDAPDGIIVRPIEISEKLINSLVTAQSNGIFVVLVDIDVRENLFPKSLRQYPFFVGSHFSEGGKLVATNIREFFDAHPTASSAYLMLGPSSIPSAAYRGKSIVWNLYILNCHTYTKAVWLDVWDRHAAVLALFDALLKHSEIESDETHYLYLFCANDNIATYLLHVLISRKNEVSFEKYRALIDKLRAKKLYIMGYDGLRDEEDFKLKHYITNGINLVTIDVKPSELGRLAADVMRRGLTSGLPAQQRQELITPELVQFKNE